MHERYTVLTKTQARRSRRDPGGGRACAFRMGSGGEGVIDLKPAAGELVAEVKAYF